MNSLKHFFRSVRHALRGLIDLFRQEQSFRLQVLIAILVLLLTVVFPLEMWEQILIVLLCAAVLILEILNSLMERFVDALQPRLSSMVREVKDMMAGAVLITALTSAVVGGIIFYPHIYNLVCAILGSCGGR